MFIIHSSGTRLVYRRSHAAEGSVIFSTVLVLSSLDQQRIDFIGPIRSALLERTTLARSDEPVGSLIVERTPIGDATELLTDR